MLCLTPSLMMCTPSHPPTLKVCTGVMIHGYEVVQTLCGGLQQFMKKHDFKSISDFKGASLPYFTTHTDLVSHLSHLDGPGESPLTLGWT